MEEPFVIHLHVGGGKDHYDLMLPGSGALATWRLEVLPRDLAPGGWVPAVRVADHRRAFLTYEGPLRDGKGTVRRADEGTCRIDRAEEALWQFHLAGRLSHGDFELCRTGEGTDSWRLRRR